MMNLTPTRPCAGQPDVHLIRCHELLEALPDAAGPEVAELRQEINDMADAYDVRLAELTSAIRAVVIPSLEVTISMLGERVERVTAG